MRSFGLNSVMGELCLFELYRKYEYVSGFLMEGLKTPGRVFKKHRR